MVLTGAARARLSEAILAVYNDPEQRTFSQILVDILAADIVEPWGGGKWHLEIFRATGAEPEAWNGEI